MAITSEIIGKLGGSAGVEVTPVEGAASGPWGSEEVLHAVEVPEGETWLVALHGTLGSVSEGSKAAELIIGTTKLPPRAPNGITGLAHVGTGTIEVKIVRQNSYDSDRFTGHVYAVKL